MRQVTGSMMNVVKGMDQAMKAMDLEKVCLALSPSKCNFICRVELIWVEDFRGDGSL
jgi:hypothetical protein